MPDVLSAWLAILLVSGVTLASRLSGPILMARLPMSTTVERFLQNLSLSVIAALVASMLMRGGLREAASVTAAALVMVVFPQIDLGNGGGHAGCSCLIVSIGIKRSELGCETESAARALSVSSHTAVDHAHHFNDLKDCRSLRDKTDHWLVVLNV